MMIKSPKLMLNGNVKTKGFVPFKARVNHFIRETRAELENSNSFF